MSEDTLLSDDPITSLTQDQLEFAGYVNRIVNKITNAPSTSSFRLGVYGPWGSGKSSVLHMIDQELRSHQVNTFWVYPWAYSSPDQFRSALLERLAESLNLRSAEHSFTRWFRDIGRSARSTASNAGLKLKIADAVLGPTIDKYSDKFAEWGREKVLKRAQEEVADKRTVVFIDDLDRANPEILPEVLLTIRTALDFSNLFYVLALSPQIVDRGIRSQHEGWEKAGSFLAKAIQYPTYVPNISDPVLDDYLAKKIETLDIPIPTGSLEAVSDLIKKHPRSIKLYLRHLQSLTPLLNRFDDDELDYVRFMIAQLLSLEYPKQTRDLAEDDEALKDLQWGDVKDRVGDDGITETEIPADSYAPDSEEREEDARRYRHLIRALRSESSWGTHYSIKEILQLEEEPPEITEKEKREFFNEYQAVADPDRAEVLRLFLSNGAEIQTQRLLAGFHMAVEIRHELLKVAADTAEDTEVAAIINDEVPVAGELIRRFLHEYEVLSFEDFGVSDWLHLYRHLSEFSEWTTPEYYRRARARELDILQQSLDVMPQEVASEVLGQFYQQWILRDEIPRGINKGFADIIREFLIEQEERVAESVLREFREPQALKGYYGPKKDTVEAMVLFNAQSAFYSGEIIGDLSDLAEEAGTDANVRSNFLTFFRILAHGAQGAPGGYPRSQCRKILGRRDFCQMVWSAAMARRLNRRHTGSMLEDKEALMDLLDHEEDVFPEPRWVQEVVSTDSATGGDDA